MADNPPETVAAEGKKPTVDKSFEVLLTKVEKYDEELVKGWKEDIDTLLVFGGLFSAVVTAFLIEAYQKLEEDPADKTVALLEQLVSLQQPNTSETPGISPNLSPFTPDASTIRINCFWLLSLIFSLTSALFGLLCKQWVREFQRDTPTNTPAEALALRQLRRESFEKWNVPAFLAALPILLEIALLFFFAGILDLLWGLHTIPFAISLVAVLLSAGLYSITTLLPTLTIPRDLRMEIKWQHFEKLSYQFICPYKSPQAWLFYRFVCKVLHPLSKFWKSTEDFEDDYYKPAPALRYHIESPASDWSSFDLRVVRQYDQHVQDHPDFSLPINLFSLQVYQLRAFEWAVTMFRDSPLMIPHLQNVLGTILPSVAMSAVLGHWDVALWSDVSRADVELGVADPAEFRRQYIWNGVADFPQLPTTAIPDPAICQSEGIKFFFQHQYLMMGNRDSDIRAALEQMGMQTAGFHFVTPLSVTGRLWAHQDAGVQKRALTLLQLYEESWKSCSGVENDDDDGHLKERLAFIWVLAKHITHTDRTSVLITSKRGREFIRFIHHEIITQQFYCYDPFFNHVEWQRAIERTQEVGNLPPDYFAPLPHRYGPRPDLPPLPPRRYSLEAETGVELDHDNKAPDSQLDGSLPSGWEQLTTPEGRPYFFDHKIGTVTWEDPRHNILPASGSQLDGPLPPGWERRTYRGGSPYFFHRDTCTATWLDPRRRALAGGQVAESSGSGNPQASGSQLDGSLPSGWEQRNILGTPYFIDLDTDAVFWKDPRQFVPAHQVAESSGSGNLQASGSQPEGRLPPSWGQGTFLGTPYFFHYRTRTATWKDPRQIDPAGQVAESSGSGNPWISQDDNHVTSSRSQAIDANADSDPGVLSEVGQQSNSDPAPNNAEVEGSSGISSSDIQGSAPMSPPSDSSSVQPTDHPTGSSDPPAPMLTLSTLRTDDSNRDTEVSSPQDDGETLDIQTIQTSGDIENAGNSSVLGRGHITFAGGGGPSHLHSAHDVGNESIRRNAEGAGADRTSDEVLDSLVASSTGDIDTENMNVVQCPASEEHTITQDAPLPLVDLGVNEQTNHLAARTEEQHTRSSRDTEENIHPENSSIVTGEGASTVDLAHLSGKDKDYHSPPPGEIDVSCLDDPEPTARARNAVFGVSAHSEQDEQALGASSEQDAQGPDGSQRKDVHTTDRGQGAQSHLEVEYGDEYRSGVHNDAEILHPDQDIDTRNPNMVTQSPERTVSQDPPSPPVDEQVAHIQGQGKQHPE
ncbi:hypothetical protein VNI00_018763 [Paramarasmius palmivorus]|uniref:WW domain-containing protein n=1 Tax=Paramarasmius palmivorus TaxID=297713 RepID=A0AAW0AV24_9AGAR